MNTCPAYGHGWWKTSCLHSRHTRGRCSVINLSDTATPSPLRFQPLVCESAWLTHIGSPAFVWVNAHWSQTNWHSCIPEFFRDVVRECPGDFSFQCPPRGIVSVLVIWTQQHKRGGHPDVARWWKFLEGVILLKQTKRFNYNIMVTFLACPFFTKWRGGGRRGWGAGREEWGGGRGQGRRRDLCIFVLHWSSWIVT